MCIRDRYKVSKKNGKHEDVVYAWDDEELENAKKQIGRGYNVPVSYTHLDVYKRQYLNKTKCNKFHSCNL